MLADMAKTGARAAFAQARRCPSDNDGVWAMIAGADWCRGTWLTAVSEGEGPASVRMVSKFEEFLRWSDLDALVIDVPIGLPDRGSRSCDGHARKLIGPRRNSVFSAPIRPVLVAKTHDEASTIRERVEGKRCSAQAFGIYSIIADVDSHMTRNLQGRVREGHPEVSFAHLNGGNGLAHYKGTPDGQAERIELLQPHLPDVWDLVAGIKPKGAAVDLIDALAMLWTARRVVEGRAVSIPDQPEFDSGGLRMEMVV